MKFGKQLQLGTYAPWKDYYIQYSRLKRIIKRRKFVLDNRKEAIESAALVTKQSLEMARLKTVPIPSPGRSATGATGAGAGASVASPSSLNRMNPSESTPLNAATGLPRSLSHTEYGGKGKEKGGDKTEDVGIDFFPVIVQEIQKINDFFVGKVAELRILLEEVSNERGNKYITHHTASDASHWAKLRSVYVELAALRSYSELNKTGFYKIIKKYDKCMQESTLEEWTLTVDSQPFTNTTEAVQLLNIVTSMVSRDKLLEWELFATEQSRPSLDDVFPAVRPMGLLFSIAVFILAWNAPLIPNATDPAASRCLAMLLLVISLWITEAMPYFATGLCIPVLVTVLGILKDPNDSSKLMETEKAAMLVMNSIFNHTTMLLLGGYAISSAFSRSQLELRVASYLQWRFGHQPKTFIIAIMFVGLFLSMWISNHTAPILCATIVLPIVRDLPSDSRFSKAMLLGLAFACNIGGMMTPISSVQNVLAISQLQSAGYTVSFGRWLLISIPFSIIATVGAWVIVIKVIQPDDVEAIPVIVYERGSAFGKRNYVIIGLSLLCITMFAFSSPLKPIFGDIGIISLMFLIAVFGSGMLTEVDFNSFSWHTLFLVGGGNVLGIAITSSGLLNYIAEAITAALPLDEPWIASLLVVGFCGVVATFVSHTVASLILMPIITTVGATLGRTEMVVIGSAFAVSAAMSLPFSSFPNVNSLLIVDDFQRPYLGVNDFLKAGTATSVFTTILIGTFGFFLIDLVV